MRLFDKKVLFENHDVEGAVLVHSFIEYKANGGIHDAFDTYAHFKELAKKSGKEYNAYLKNIKKYAVQYQTIVKELKKQGKTVE